MENPLLQTHIIAARGRGPWRSQRRIALLAASVATVACNSMRREWLTPLLERTCFHTHERDTALDFARLPTRYVPLRADSVRDAALASGSIPLLSAGVVSLEHGEVYWDGGMTDYHFEPDFGDSGALALYPHFYSFLIPGWFDKGLPWRRRAAVRWPNLVLLCPSREFVSGLPFGRIPDRRDFRRLPTAERQRVWRRVAAESARLADDFASLCEQRGLARALAGE